MIVLHLIGIGNTEPSAGSNAWKDVKISYETKQQHTTIIELVSLFSVKKKIKIPTGSFLFVVQTIIHVTFVNLF